MKRFLLIALSLIAVVGCSDKTKSAKSKFIYDYKSSFKFEKTINIVKNSLKNKNYQPVFEFNHEKEALKLKQMLYPTVTIELNNPKISTKLISCNPTIAQDLPIRVAVYNEINGQTHVSFTDPEYWSLKHNIKDSECINLLFVIKNDLEELAKEVTKK